MAENSKRELLAMKIIFTTDTPSRRWSQPSTSSSAEQPSGGRTLHVRTIFFGHPTSRQFVGLDDRVYRDLADRMLASRRLQNVQELDAYARSIENYVLEPVTLMRSLFGKRNSVKIRMSRLGSISF